MNPTTEPPLPPQLQPPQPPQPPRSSTSCDRHPDERFTGFCPLCLCERLAVLDPSSSSAPAAPAPGPAPAASSSSSSSRKPPSSSSAAASALKAIFKPGSSSSNSSKPPAPAASASAFLPELRRTKSFSASKNEGFFSGIFEPQRKSCDVRVRNTLWSLFSLDDERNPSSKRDSTRSSNSEGVQAKSLGSAGVVRGPVLESKEEDAEAGSDYQQSKEYTVQKDEEEEEDDEIRAWEEPNVAAPVVVENRVQEIVEEEEEEEEEEVEIEEIAEPELEVVPEEEVKTMKDHIDLDSQAKKSSGRDFKEIAGSFWSAASVFSKKWQNWRRKQKMKKRDNGSGSATLPVEKPIGRQFRETQSEIADYGFGRRSCDTDPRFSLDAARISFDAARMSFDDPRYSFDEPRASWDGHLIGRSFPRMPTMVSVVEDSPVHVSRTDTQIPVEEPMNCINEEASLPGGSAQTRDYYLDSSSRRRKSLDRSNSIRKTAAAVVAEIDELKSGKNAKVSPATADYFQGSKPIVGDRESRESISNSNSLRDDCSDMFDLAFRDNAASVNNGDPKGLKKSRRWGKGWSIWGFIHRRGGNKDENDDRYSRSNGVERSFSESWPELRGEHNGDLRGGFNRKVFRSNSSVSCRNSSYNHLVGGSFGSIRKSVFETNGQNGKKKRDEFVLERNRSARYSPNNLDNGLLRFYLTPMRGSRRSGSGKSRANQAQSIARSVLRLY
ncbi:protein OCTOPUS-like [Syzygium oleosum]|uniref:protein OCTOPUS-like n=1 Tax=Syzygium oleosum TaxID=219896 RepID=UPI0011D1A273|nr:protein OCTOPUS-like [Syzygium oleosum]